MKYIIILGDGMADERLAKLGDRTPLMAADKPSMDLIAKKGRTGQFRTIEDHMATGSAVANLSVLGYNPDETYKGRGVLEAASIGVELEPGDIAMRVNLINIKDSVIKSHAAGHITDAEAGKLVKDLGAGLLAKHKVSIYQGLSYRHVLVIPGGNENLSCAPPHDNLGVNIRDIMVKPLSPDAKPTADLLNGIILQSQEFLSGHPVNKDRVSRGLMPANSLWPWSPGSKPVMKTLKERFGIKGAIITAVDLIKGLGIYAGMDIITVEGATGLFDTNYEGKADACLRSIRDHDLVYVHVEATDEASHDLDLDLKIKCIENLDRRLVKRILEGIKDTGEDITVALLPDHPTPVSHGAHTRDPVPVAIWDPSKEPDGVESYDEESVRKGSLGLLRGDQFIKTVLNKL